MHPKFFEVNRAYEHLINHKNEKANEYNGIFDRYKNPVLTARHIPPMWKYDFDEIANPYFMERLGVNAVFNAGAIKIDDKYVLVARIEGCDRKSFFGVAESTSPSRASDSGIFRLSFPTSTKTKPMYTICV